MTDHEKKQKLRKLGTEALTDALLDLTILSDDANNMVERLIATPDENIKRFKKKLSSIKRSKRFIDWRGATFFAQEIEMLLQDLRAGVTDSLTGINLLADFYKADGKILERCDDSNGCIGDIFRIDANELFIEYASHYPDKDKIADIILKLVSDDNYGVRNVLIYSANEHLPESVIRTMIAKLQATEKTEKSSYKKSNYSRFAKELARQIKDAELFEKLCTVSEKKYPTTIINIANVYLENDDAETAYAWIQKIPEEENCYDDERKETLLKIYKKQGDTSKLSDLLYQEFKLHHTTDKLQALLSVIGEDKQKEIIDEAISDIMTSKSFNSSDAKFFIEIGKIDEAEQYIITHSEQLDGIFYTSLLPLVKTMETEGRNLAAILIYRSLIIAILNKGYTKAYSHGIRYLKKTDKLATTITDWQHFDTHETFKDEIRQEHFHKRSFWSKYDPKM